MIEVTTETSDRGLGLKERRAFMKLPLEERQRRLAEQAAKLVEHYVGRTESREREEWQGGDVVDGLIDLRLACSEFGGAAGDELFRFFSVARVEPRW